MAVAWATGSALSYPVWVSDGMVLWSRARLVGMERGGPLALPVRFTPPADAGSLALLDPFEVLVEPLACACET